MDSEIPSGVFPLETAYRANARAVAERLRIALLDAAPQAGELYLRLDDAGLGLHRGGSRQKPMRADFLSPALAYRRRSGGGFRQPLARAVGVTGERKPTVLDTTAGLGRDGFILASLGCDVVMLERSEVVGELLSDALERARMHGAFPEVLARMKLAICDASVWLAGPKRLASDVIYIDPMFPPRRKSALGKGEMQLLKALVGEGEDVAVLLAPALALGSARVVVKRPRLAAVTEGRAPDFMLKGTSTRFDVYLPRNA